MSLERGAVFSARGGELSVGERECDFVVMELKVRRKVGRIFEYLLNVGTTSFTGLNLLNLHNLNASVGGAVATVHLLKELVNGTNSGSITEFLPDVVVGSIRLITKRNPKVFNDSRRLLVDLRMNMGT